LETINRSGGKWIKLEAIDSTPDRHRFIWSELGTPLWQSPSRKYGTLRYYDLKRNWTKKVEPHLGDAELNRVLVTNFNKFTYGRWGIEFKPGEFPRQHETCLWDFDHRGPEPRYWRYVKHAACHWLVNFHLRLAMLVMPKRPWRIIRSNNHSTVWDGKETLFDFNYQALEVSPDECFQDSYVRQRAARASATGRVSQVGVGRSFSVLPGESDSRAAQQ
jgi:hypothetical protein